MFTLFKGRLSASNRSFIGHTGSQKGEGITCINVGVFWLLHTLNGMYASTEGMFHGITEATGATMVTGTLISISLPHETRPVTPMRYERRVKTPVVDGGITLAVYTSDTRGSDCSSDDLVLAATLQPNDCEQSLRENVSVFAPGFGVRWISWYRLQRKVATATFDRLSTSQSK